MKKMATRKVRMGYYVEQICRVLQHLPVTQANEIELEALWLNIKDSHSDIADKLTNNKTAEEAKEQKFVPNYSGVVAWVRMTEFFKAIDKELG